MSDSMRAAHATPGTVGLVGLPDLADFLTRGGFTVVTGETYRAAATAIKVALDEGAPFPLICSDAAWPGIRAWIEAIATRTSVVVVRVEGGSGIAFKGVTEVTAPCSVTEVMAATGDTTLDANEAALALDGSLAPAPVRETVPAALQSGPTTPSAPAPAPDPLTDPLPYDPSPEDFAPPAPVSQPQTIEDLAHAARPVPTSQPTDTAAAPPAPPTPAPTTGVEYDPWEEPAAPIVATRAPQPVQVSTSGSTHGWSDDDEYDEDDPAEATPAPAPLDAVSAQPVPAPVPEPPTAPYDPWEDSVTVEPPPVAIEPPAPEPVVAPQPAPTPHAPQPVPEPVQEPVPEPVQPPETADPTPVVFSPPPVETAPIPVVTQAPVYPPPAPVPALAPAPVESEPVLEAPVAHPSAAPHEPVIEPPGRGPVPPPSAPVMPTAPAPVENVPVRFEAADLDVAVPEPSAADKTANAMQSTIVPSPAGPGVAETIVTWAGKGGVGKAVTLDTTLPTPDGWITMADVEVGSHVLGRDGRPTAVTAKFDHDDLELFDLHLSDGQIVRACADHRWIVSGYYDRINAAHPHRVAAGERWDRLGRFADACLALADSFPTDMVATGQEVAGHVLALDDCPWKTAAPVRQIVSHLGTRMRTAQVNHRRSVKVYPTETFLGALLATLDAGLANTTMRNSWRRYAAVKAATEAVLNGVAPDEVTAAETNALIQGFTDVPVFAGSDLVKMARRSGTLESRAEVRDVPASNGHGQQYPMAIALKTVAASVIADLPESRPDTFVRERVMTTAEMLREGVVVMAAKKPTSNFAIRLTAALDLPTADLPVDPYVLGAWLGDGATNAAEIYSDRNPNPADPDGLADVDRMLANLKPFYPAKIKPSSPHGISVPGLGRDLRAAGVFGSKHIPMTYLRASADQRLALLQGLMDTDGTVATDGGCAIALSDRRLATDVLELVRSLGIKARMRWDRPAGYNDANGDWVSCKNSHVLTFTTDRPVFRMPRKTARMPGPGALRPTQDWIYITDITPAERGPGRCITVDAPDHSFLVGQFVPTHNTTVSASLAQRAAKAGLRVILIDANRGQGDMRTFLRIGQAGLPSIYQAALSGELRSALIDPDSLTRHRSPKLDPLAFALVQAPPAHLTNLDVVTPEVYMHVIEQARKVCDVVIVDTQIVESSDTSGMVDRLVAPLMRAGAWGVGISDLSSAGITNLITRLRAFAVAGISRERQVTILSRIPRSVSFNAEGVASAFNEHSIFLGTVYSDDSVPQAMNAGRPVSSNPVLAPILDAALNRVTGMHEFAPSASGEVFDDEEDREEQHSRGGLRSLFRRGRD